MPTLNELLMQAWSEYDRFQNEPEVVHPSVPVLYFGDSRGYLESPLKVVTVCLNPSLQEFPKTDPFSRFPAAEPAHTGTAIKPEQRADCLQTALDNYFKENPYNEWFRPSFEAFLKRTPRTFSVPVS